MEGQAGNGPKPFAFNRDNELILRLILGATLRNLPSSDVKMDEKLGRVRARLSQEYFGVNPEFRAKCELPEE